MLRLCWVTIITFVILPRNGVIFTQGWGILDRHGRSSRKLLRNLTPQSTFIRNECESECATSRPIGTTTATYHHPPSQSSPFNVNQIPILYESETVLAILKPPHISHHDSSTEMGILNHIRFLQTSTTTTTKQFYQGRIYGIHRLDRVTSGILLLAKTKQAAQYLGKAFRDGRVTKYYVALSNKRPKKKKQGWVRGDMVRSRRKSWKLNTSCKDPATTRFFTAGLGDIGMEGPAAPTSTDTVHELTNPLPPKTLILFRPHTGKTHQLRVAGKSVGLPILGDAVYGDAEDALMSQRTYLHAAALHVQLDGEEIAIWCPPNWFDHFRVSCDGNDGGTTTEKDPLGKILVNLMQKHCDSEPICNLVFKNHN